MSLNIYHISHPIIQILSTYISNQRNNDKFSYEYYYRYTGFLLIYETLRKYIKLEAIYIKQLYSVKNLNVLNPKNKYLICTNISQTYHIITDIKSIVPNIKILNINYKDNKNIKNSIDEMKISLKDTKIFIVEKKTNDENILNLIQYLKDEKHISLSNINLTSIFINHQTLNKLGSKYPELKVYTTKIIYNNKK
uniref:Uracil phosphoribosyltransferase n=1 Tax=Thaumatella adunca TaxID=2006976 RepID=A0A1Z1MNV3_9FLOR|nr:uracil phosphoribosyltransferase [Thaumatella adunca]ARW67539.1 uracil phosphoribosyltransferase [Thaumatella adunca]